MLELCRYKTEVHVLNKLLGKIFETLPQIAIIRKYRDTFCLSSCCSGFVLVQTMTEYSIIHHNTNTNVCTATDR